MRRISKRQAVQNQAELCVYAALVKAADASLTKPRDLALAVVTALRAGGYEFRPARPRGEGGISEVRYRLRTLRGEHISTVASGADAAFARARRQATTRQEPVLLSRVYGDTETALSAVHPLGR